MQVWRRTSLLSSDKKGIKHVNDVAGIVIFSTGQVDVCSCILYLGFIEIDSTTGTINICVAPMIHMNQKHNQFLLCKSRIISGGWACAIVWDIWDNHFPPSKKVSVALSLI